MPFLAPTPKTPNQTKLAGLDHLRALAITLVFLFHYRLFAHPEWIDIVGKFGWTGVDLFFVLSGYLISSQLFGAIAKSGSINIKEFYVKRFFRIIPAYLTVVAIYFCIPAFREREALSPLWKFLTFTQNFGLDLRTHGTFSHAWSLCIEEQFYLLLPLILTGLAYFRRNWSCAGMLAALFIMGFAARLFSWYHFLVPLSGTDGFGLAWYKYMYYPTYNRLDGLLTGIAIAALFRFRPALKERIFIYGNYLVLLGAALLAAAYFVCMDERTFAASVFGFPLVSIGYGTIVMAALSPSCFLYRQGFGITGNIAALSFAVYLMHKGIIHITQLQLAKLGVADDGNVMLLLSMISSLAGAWILHKVIEKPFLKLRSRLLNRLELQSDTVKKAS